MSLYHKLGRLLSPPQPDALERFRLLPAKLLHDFDILAHEQGLLKTMETMLPVDAAGNPIPWFTYPAIEYFNQLDVRGKTIFEYGCGHSTLYWKRKGASIWAVDHNKDWFDKMSANAALAGSLYLAPDQDGYAAAIEQPGIQFDIIVIDGAYREACVEPAVRRLQQGGMIILDNADRDLETARLLRERNFFEVDFNGFGPINDYTWTTAIFLPQPGPSRFALAPPRPIGGHAANPDPSPR